MRNFLKKHAVILGILALALGARLVHLNRGMWIDELATWNATRQTMSEMFTARMEVGHLPLYFVLMRMWTQLVGPHAWLLRLTSVALGLGSVFFTYLLGSGALNRRTRWLAAAILSIHAGALWSSQTIRPYELLALLSVISAWALLERESQGRGGWLVAILFLSTLAGLLTQALYGLVVVSQLVYLAWSHGRQVVRRQWPVLLALAASVILAMPSYQAMAHTQKITDRINPTLRGGLLDLRQAITGLVVGEYDFLDIGLWIQIPALAAAIVTTAIVLRALRGGPVTNIALDESADSEVQSRRLLRYLVCWIGIWAVTVFLALYLTQIPHKGLRYYWPLLPGVCCMMAACVRLIPDRLWRGGYIALLAIAMLPVTAGWMAYRGDGLSDAIHYVEKRRKPSERVVGVKGSVIDFGYRFYRPEAASQLTQLGISRKQEGAARLLKEQAPVNGTCWLIVYHDNKKSAAIKAARDEKDFKILKRKRFNEAIVLHVMRRS